MHCGAFDGRGFILKGFVTKQIGTGTSYATLFYINQGTIKNIIISNPTLGGNFTSTRNNGLLVFINSSSGTNHGLIDNCVAYGDISAFSSNTIDLGVFAINTSGSAKINGCTNNMSITLSGTGISRVGGIACYALVATMITNNVNYGNLRATNLAGGILAMVSASTENPNIEGNKNYGSITTTNTTGSSTGGIIGYLTATTTTAIKNNINYGLITSYGTSPACGIASGGAENTGFTHGAVKDAN